MKAYFTMVKRWDVIVIIGLVLLSFTPTVVFGYIQAGKITENSQQIAVVSVDGKEVQRINLTENLGTNVLNIPEIDCNPNTVEVNDERIRIRKSDCPDQICIRTGYISKPGQTIICIPHKVIIEVITDEEIAEEIIISA